MRSETAEKVVSCRGAFFRRASREGRRRASSCYAVIVMVGHGSGDGQDRFLDISIKTELNLQRCCENHLGGFGGKG
jgi:hypothetical protein